MDPDRTVLREHLLIKLRVTPATRPEITEAVNIFRGKVVDFNADSMIIEITGSPQSSAHSSSLQSKTK